MNTDGANAFADALRVNTVLTRLDLDGTFMRQFGREGGIPRVWVAGLKGQKVQSFERIEFDEDAYDVGGAGNYEYVVGGGLWSAQERDRAGKGSQLTPSSLVLASHAGTTPTP